MQPEALAQLAEEIHKRGLDVLTYTGFTFEQIIDSGDDRKLALLKQTDYLIDGKFVLALRSLELHFRGSSNQRIIDVKRSLEEGRAVETDL